MNKFIIVGHPQSYIKEVEFFLQKCGMKDAYLSKNDELSPIQITEIICKENGVFFNDFEREISQIEVSSIWDRLVLDLFLTNSSQLIWGWSDSNAIHLLDFYKEKDNKAFFVLVYSHPENFFNMDFVCNDDVEEYLNYWYNYNVELLDFYINNKERCLLLNIETLIASHAEVIDSLNNKINENFNYKKNMVSLDDNEVKKGRISARKKKQILTRKIENNEFSEKYFFSKKEFHLSESVSPNDLIEKYLIKKIINENLDLKSLIDSLEESTEFPVNYCEKNNFIGSLDLWNEYICGKRKLLENKNNILFHQKAIKNLEEKLEKTVAEKEVIEKKRNSQLERLNELKDIEKKANWRLERLNELKGIEKKANWRLERLNELKNIEEKANWRLNKIKQLEESNTELKRKNDDTNLDFILHQLGQLKIELEYYYSENKKLKNLLNNTKSIDKSLAKQEVVTGAAERVKSELAYRLGNTVIMHSKSLNGILSLPSALLSTVRKNNQITHMYKDLPPIESYADASEVEKVQKHLSYRIGDVMLKYHTPNKWGYLMVNLYKEVKSYKSGKN